MTTAELEDEQSVIRLLIATDNHLGYMEKDPVRGQDSFESFEEILRIAAERNVDAILLGGDLFHDNKPSRSTLHKTIELFRVYCEGTRPSQLDILSDQSVNFPNRFATANYLDENRNIAMPVFSIHGNHDDPSGAGNLSAMDLLSACGLVNYFGKQRDYDQINIAPIVLQKGDTKLAVYGLGAMRDDRLHRAFRQGQVKLLMPPNHPTAFKMFVIHQNRVKHGETNYIPETFLDDAMDLIFWGHEHECIIDPARNPEHQFYVTQPGSSIATSLCEGESKTKHVGILSIQGSSFQLEKIRLSTVRPFVMQDIILADEHLNPFDNKSVETCLTRRVESMIQEAELEWRSEPANQGMNMPLPLIRLRVNYEGGFFQTNPQRFGQQFVNRIANPKDCLFYMRKKAVRKEKVDVVLPEVYPETNDAITVEALVNEFLSAQTLKALPENELAEALRQFVEKDEKDAIPEFFEKSVKLTQRRVQQKKPAADNEEELETVIEQEKVFRVEAYQNNSTQVQFDDETMDMGRPRPAPANRVNRVVDDEFEAAGEDLVLGSRRNSDTMDMDSAPARQARTSRTTTSTSTRGRGRVRGTSRKASTSTRGRNKKQESESEPEIIHETEPSDEDEASDFEVRDPSDDNDDFQQQDDDDDEEIIVDDSPKRTSRTAKAAASTSTAAGRKRKAPTKPAATRATTTKKTLKQPKLSFTASQASGSQWPPRRK